MPLTQEQKKEIFTEYGVHEKDTGSAEAQIALLTYRINHLTEHLKNNNKKDFSTRRGLTSLVGQRRRLQRYLKDNRSPEQYAEFIKRLNLRK